MNKNIILMIIVGLLIIISAVQAVQLTSLKAEIDSGAVKVGSAKTPSTTTPAASGIQDLPQMVGGC